MNSNQANNNITNDEKSEDKQNSLLQINKEKFPFNYINKSPIK